jgi:hypothetical protein
MREFPVGVVSDLVGGKTKKNFFGSSKNLGEQKD